MIITKSKHKKEIFNSTNHIEMFNFLFKAVSITNFKKLSPQIEQKLINLMEENSEICWTDAKSQFSKIFNNSTSKQIEYWLNRGWTEKDAKTQISKYSKVASKKGNNKRCEQIKKLKKENPKKLKEQFNTNIEYYLAKGMTQKEAEEALKDRQTTFSKKKLIEKHGEEKGLEILEKRNKQWISTLKENNDWDELSKKKATTLEKFIEKYGEEEGTIKWKKLNIQKSKINTYMYYIKKYGKEEGTKKWNKRINNILVKSGKASKESLKIFIPILHEFENKFSCFLGYKNLNEWFIWDDSLKKQFRYDFTLKEPKLIIEYNGEAFHPNKDTLTESEWNEWKTPFEGLTADEKFDLDQYKINLAKENGFKILELWSSNSVEENIKLSKNFILKHI